MKVNPVLALVWTMAETAHGAIPYEDAMQLMNGRGPANLKYKPAVDLDAILTNFPTCDNKCVGSTPCGSASVLSIGSSCLPTNSYGDYDHCLHGYVCCDPSKCRAKAQNSCQYGSSLTKNNLASLNYKSLLRLLNDIGASTSKDIESVKRLANSTIATTNTQRCTTLCNGWNDVWKCPTSCQCTQIDLPTLVVGPTYRCVASDYGASGYAAPISKFPNGTVVCPVGYRCADVDSNVQCISSPRLVDSSISSSPAPSYTKPNDNTTAIAVGSACGAVGLLGACYFFFRKKKHEEHPVENDHYHEAPNGA